MNEPSSIPPVKKAYDFVRENLEKGTWSAGERMPTTRALAQSAGVGINAMTSAIGELKALGFMGGLRRGYLRAGNNEAHDAGQRGQSNSLWQMKRTALEKDILSGTFAHRGKLPALKELLVRYGACFSTMKKILGSLVDDGVVRVRGKSYELPNHRATGSQPRLAFVTNKFLTPPRSALNPGEYRVIDTMERECVRRGIKLDLIEIDMRTVGGTSMLPDTMFGAAIVGFVLDVWWIDSPEIRGSYLDLLDRLAKTRKPVAILDELNNFNLPVRYSHNPLLQVFRIEGACAGARIGRMLLNLGHSSVAYITTAATESWSQLRLQGVEDQFTKAGLRHAVFKFNVDYSTDSLPLILALSDFSQTIVRRVLLASRSREQTEAICSTVARLRHETIARRFKPDDVHAIRLDLAVLKKIAHDTTSENVFGPLVFAVQKRVDMRIGPIILAPILEKALHNRSITAWICANDLIAFDALPFLQKRKIKVPDQISVTGFDNLPVETLERRLTSFDFNAPGFAYRMVEFILRAPKKRGGYRHVPVEIEGYILERETTGKARAQA